MASLSQAPQAAQGRRRPRRRLGCRVALYLFPKQAAGSPDRAARVPDAGVALPLPPGESEGGGDWLHAAGKSTSRWMFSSGKM